MGRIFLSINKWWNSGFSTGTAQPKEIVLVHHPFNKKHILISRVVWWGEGNAHLHNPWSYDTLDNRIGGTTLELGNCHTRNWWSLPVPPTNPASHPGCRPSRKHLQSSPKPPCFFGGQKVETKTTTKRILSHGGVVPRLQKLLETPSFDWHQIHTKGNQRNPFSFNVSILKSSLFPVMKGIPNLKSLPNWTQFDIFDKSFSREKWSWFILIQFFKSTYMWHTWVAILGLGSQPGETDISIQIGIKRVNSSNFVFIKLLNLRRIWPLFSRR